jgi:hypothetical protein
MEQEEQTSEWLERRLVDHWPRLQSELQRCGDGGTPRAPDAAPEDGEDEDEGSLAVDVKPHGGSDHAVASSEDSCELSDAQLACVVGLCFPQLKETGDDSAGDDDEQRLDACVRRLAEWLFMDPGQHGCLSFLGVLESAEPETKAQVFVALAPGVMLRMLNHNAGRAVVRELAWTARQWEQIQLALRVSLLSAATQRHKTLAAVAALVAPVLVSCLAFVGAVSAYGTVPDAQAGLLVAMLTRSDDPDLTIGTLAQSDARVSVGANACRQRAVTLVLRQLALGWRELWAIRT